MSDDEQQEQTIAEDLVVTKYKMGGDIANREFDVTSDGGVGSVTRASTLLSRACHVLGRDEQRGTPDPSALTLCNMQPLKTCFKCMAVPPVHVYKACALFAVLQYGGTLSGANAS